MLATNLLGYTVCLRFPKKHNKDEANPLHKTKGFIRVVYLDTNGYLKFSVETENTAMLETIEQHQMILCGNITFKDAVRQIEKEDKEQ